jgi:hypothetical protein
MIFWVGEVVWACVTIFDAIAEDMGRKVSWDAL